jgi:hypothetical protein
VFRVQSLDCGFVSTQSKEPLAKSSMRQRGDGSSPALKPKVESISENLIDSAQAGSEQSPRAAWGIPKD